MPAHANGSHITCTSPPWGSLYAAELETPQGLQLPVLQVPVLIVLFDGDYQLPIPKYSNAGESAGLPAYCNTQQTETLFNFSPLWTQVLRSSMHLSVYHVQSACWRRWPISTHPSVNCVRFVQAYAESDTSRTVLVWEPHPRSLLVRGSGVKDDELMHVLLV